MQLVASLLYMVHRLLPCLETRETLYRSSGFHSGSRVEHPLKPVGDGPWRPSQHGVTIVDTGCNESVYKSRCRVCVEWSTYSVDLTEPIEARCTYSRHVLGWGPKKWWLRANTHGHWLWWSLLQAGVTVHCCQARQNRIWTQPREALFYRH